MSSNKVLLTTVFSGYNYGSSLQALAGKTILKELGYDCQLVAMKSLVKGRDIRLKKLLTILVRSLMLRGKNGSKSLSIYQNSYNKTMIGDSAFYSFLGRVLAAKLSLVGWHEESSKRGCCLFCR